MNTQEIIASGKLEMYVCGALPADEINEIKDAIETHPDVKREVEQIEAALIHLGKTVAPPLQKSTWEYIINKISNLGNSTQAPVRRLNWPAITGWAAAIIFMGGILWMVKQNNSLNNTIQITTTENTVLKEEKNKIENQLAANDDILNVLRSKDYQSYILPGNQAVAPNAFAKVYLNKKENITYIDIAGLPEAPRGKVYQVWALKMEPLTPTSVGLIASQNKTSEEGIYKFEGIPAPEAFGITLEPEGGSEAPTLSQLYTLGKVVI